MWLKSNLKRSDLTDRRARKEIRATCACGVNVASEVSSQNQSQRLGVDKPAHQKTLTDKHQGRE